MALFWLFEPFNSGITPVADAAWLAQRALVDDYLDARRCSHLQAPRRANAAMDLVATFAAEDHVRRIAHPVLAIYGIRIDSVTRHRLRRFVGSQDAGLGDAFALSQVGCGAGVASMGGSPVFGPAG